MTSTALIIFIIGFGLQTLSICIITTIFYQPRHSRLRSFLIYAGIHVTSVLVVSTFFMSNVPVRQITLLVSGVVGLILAYRESWSKIMLAIVFEFIAMAIGDVLTVIITTSIYGKSISLELATPNGKPISAILCQACCVLFMTVIYYSCMMIGKRKVSNFAARDNFLIFLFCALLTLVMMFVGYMSYLHDPIGTNILVFVAIATVLMIILLIASTQNIKKRATAEADAIMTKSLNLLQENYINELVESNQQVLTLKHDMLAHIRVIHSLLREEKYSEMEEYFQKYSEFFEFKTMFFCSKPSINAVLSSYHSTAIAAGIRCNFIFEDVDLKKISELDLCTVLSNALQNAIEACKAAGDSELFIKFHTSTKANYLIVKVENTSLPPRDDLATTKADAENHGFGTKIIRDITQKYDGTLHHDYDSDDRRFTLLLKLKMD